MADLRTLAQSVQDYVVEIRRHLHAHPETRWEENATLEYIEREARQLLQDHFFFSLTKAEGGIIIDVKATSELRRWLFRADVDALAVNEETGLPFASQIPGKMHACGHDANAAMLLGFLKAITLDPVPLKHNLRIVFQRAEENPGGKPRPESGGIVLVNQDNVLGGISGAYALHIWAPGKSETGKAGVFYSRPGSFMANSDRLQIVVKTSGGHVAMPHCGVNAVRVAHAIMDALESLPVQVLGPMEPVSLEPAIFQAGSASNVMPNSAELWYSLRTFLRPAARDTLVARIYARAEKITKGFGDSANVTLNLITGHPALFNTPEEVARIQSLIGEAGESYEETERKLGGEDFAYYLRRVPGAMFNLGANQPGGGSHHSPTFNPSEEVFWKGVHFWLLLACN